MAWEPHDGEPGIGRKESRRLQWILLSIWRVWISPWVVTDPTGVLGDKGMETCRHGDMETLSPLNSERYLLMPSRSVRTAAMTHANRGVRVVQTSHSDCVFLLDSATEKETYNRNLGGYFGGIT
ncbi:uncharacterized protein BO97DRAFT_103999 [Aspergillus homomorphus CBS 101889]|uniref:Uncharacterized protein n=1 Tax=Aspergillus homomorphus (strain CBS 101889) TaxID=1450537 RepID=A0A395HT29_ASPHC|nr:hypothetical protein BO97DRAFT_103999 [Aspergillus homomorphus CBS 101889]RAL11091.1 hypothetical protein BO97DRAFT_103999 [Aspergillus homomorphus CBS 101889]